MELVREVLRYLGAGQSAPESLYREASELLAELQSGIQPRYVYRLFPVRRENGAFCLQDTSIVLCGHTVRTMLEDCDAVFLLVCTLGAAFDNMFRAARARDMSKAVILDACGSALTEAGCDAAEHELSARCPGRFLTDRFSPGYGDMPLSLQADICGVLNASRRLGVCVTDSMTLNPQKSVTAVIGVANRPQKARVRGCAYCDMKETCTLRKSGASCQI
ncbi:MAG: methionine synthase [Oscillospiraceae bacterium]|nr:methionine synthase [Oscillospiraceae bacterium]